MKREKLLLISSYNISITNKTMARFQVCGMAFSQSKARFVHIIICVRDLEFKHMQIDISVLIVVVCFPCTFARGINEIGILILR